MEERLINLLFEVLQALIVAGITALVAVLFTKKYYGKILLANKLRKYGVYSVRTNKPTKKEWQKLFDNSTLIRIMYVSGFNFLSKNLALIEKALKEGKKIQILVSEKDSRFLSDIEYLEKKDGVREINTYISPEIDRLYKIVEEIKSKVPEYENNIEIRHYGTEYRLPVIIGEQSYIKKNEKHRHINGFLYVTLPPYKSIKSLILEFKQELETDEELDLAEMAEKHFDAIWNKESYNSYWARKKKLATKNMAERAHNNKVLIECAAQHPLVDGVYPGEEFITRLEATYKIYNQLKEQGTIANIYVPGSIHKVNGIAEKISLSCAGKKYLIDKGVPEEIIFGDEKNEKYKQDEGVYNSADECFVASKIYLDGDYRELISVCSSNQTIRKTLFYYAFGILPKCYGVPSINMYHDTMDEAMLVNEVVCSDHDWQDKDSKYYTRTRKERRISINEK